MKKMLTKADIIAADDLKIEVVPVPEWGGNVGIKALSLGQVDALRERAKTDEFKDQFGYLMLAESLVDETGELLFSFNEIDLLKAKSVPAMKRCFDVANRLNEQTPKALVEAGNDSGPTPASDSPSV